MRACHAALRGTRGAAASAAYLDHATDTLTFAGIGNVEARLWRPAKTDRLICYRGILGSALPTVRSFTAPLGHSWVLAMHTDGVSARFDFEQVSAFQDGADAQGIAEAILSEWARVTDDATVVVIDGRDLSTAQDPP